MASVVDYELKLFSAAKGVKFKFRDSRRELKSGGILEMCLFTRI